MDAAAQKGRVAADMSRSILPTSQITAAAVAIQPRAPMTYLCGAADLHGRKAYANENTMNTDAVAALIAMGEERLEKIQYNVPGFPSSNASVKMANIATGPANRILHLTAHACS
jgi:hypothetical protein